MLIYSININFVYQKVLKIKHALKLLFKEVSPSYVRVLSVRSFSIYNFFSNLLAATYLGFLVFVLFNLKQTDIRSDHSVNSTNKKCKYTKNSQNGQFHFYCFFFTYLIYSIREFFNMTE